MKPTPDWDTLIQKHLDGLTTEEEAKPPPPDELKKKHARRNFTPPWKNCVAIISL